MSTLRTYFTFRVDTWTPDGEGIVEHVAVVDDFEVAEATYPRRVNAGPARPSRYDRARG